MSSVLKVWNSSDSTVREGSFLKRFCIPFLVEMQNADGGWGEITVAHISTKPAGP